MAITAIMKNILKRSLGTEGWGKANTLGKIGIAGNVAMGAFGAYSDYSDARDQGDSVPASLLQAAGSGLLYSTPYLAPLLIGKDIAVGAYDFLQQEKAMMRQESASGQIPFRNSWFQDNRNFATMRQAGMAQAQKSEYTLQQSMMGNEARYLHKE